VEDSDGHGRNEDLEVEPKGPDQEKHQQNGFQVGPFPDIAEAFEEAPARSHRSRLNMKFAEAKQRQRTEHGDKRDRVDQEYPPGTHGGDQGAGDRRTDHARGVERCGVQRHGVRQVGFPDQLGNESVTRRRVERRDAAKQKRKRVYLPKLHEPGDGENTEAEGEGAHCRLRADQELSPVEMIGRKTGQGQQQKMRPELQRHHHADGGRVVVGQLREHEPALGNALHPCAHIGHDRPASPQPIIESFQ
jgi:hypothetical protein